MDKLKALYDKLSSGGLYTKSYEDFQTQFSDPSSQQKLYDKLSTQGLYTKSPEDFQTQFFGGEAVKKKTFRKILLFLEQQKNVFKTSPRTSLKTVRSLYRKIFLRSHYRVMYL